MPQSTLTKPTLTSVNHYYSSTFREAIVKNYLLAAALQETEMVVYYIEVEGLHPDTTIAGKPTAVCYAAMKANLPLLRYLLDKGAAVNQADALGMTPLHYATLGGSVLCIAMLIGRNATLNAINHAGQTPFALAQNQTKLTLCRELLQRHGASLHAAMPVSRRFH